MVDPSFPTPEPKDRECYQKLDLDNAEVHREYILKNYKIHNEKRVMIF